MLKKTSAGCCLIGLALTFFSINAFSKMNEETYRRVKENACSVEKLLPKKATNSEVQVADNLATGYHLNSVLRYLAGDNSFGGEYYEKTEERRFVENDTKFNDELKNIKEKVVTEDQKLYLRVLRKNEEKMLNNQLGKMKPYEQYILTKSICKMVQMTENGDPSIMPLIKKAVAGSVGKVRQANIGYFDVKVNNCYVTQNPVPNNKYASPEQWPGSRFLVIEALFKNLDNEGRLPSEGDLIITDGERRLKYDTTESIPLDGFGIYLQSINPLVTMPTKIVYRIPNEVEGEVLWVPGRNSTNKPLWCTHIRAEND